MVEWANVKPGEKILEPSAGHGAIARYFPEDRHRTLVEPSSSLASRAALSPGARVVVDRFENLDTGANKFDAIVMNPPFGRAARRDRARRQGGQAPEERRPHRRADPARRRDAKRFDKFMDSEPPRASILVGDIKLPSGHVRARRHLDQARIVVLEKQTDAESRQAACAGEALRLLRTPRPIGELFDRHRARRHGPRGWSRTKDVDAPPRAASPSTASSWRSTAKQGTVYADLKNKLGIDKFKRSCARPRPTTATTSRPLKTIQFKTAADRAEVPRRWPTRRPSRRPRARPSGVTFKTAETVHGKTGAKVFVAVPDPARRARHLRSDGHRRPRRRFGGYYSSFKGGRAIPGFQFTTEAPYLKPSS
jgi:hypothetical protein